MSTGNGGIGRSVAVGAAWMVALRLSIRLLGLVSTVILVRLLMPEDFGLLALAVFVFGVLELIGDLSLHLVLIRTPGRVRELYDTAWTIGLIRGGAIALIVVALARPLSGYFNDARLELILYAFAFMSLLTAARNVAIVDFRKELQFHKEFILQCSGKLVSFTATVACALTLRNYWALVAGMLAGEIAALVMSYTMHPYRPRLCLQRWRELISFSVWLLLTGIVGALMLRSPTAVLGRLASMDDVGKFNVAKDIAELPTTELVWPIAGALYPGFAKVGGDAEGLRAMYRDSYAAIFMLAAPVGVGLVLVTPWLVPLLLGERWLTTIPLIEILGIAGVMRTLSTGANSIYMTLARTKLYFLITCAGFVVTVPALVALTQHSGVLGAAYAYLVGVSVLTCLHLVTVTRLIGLPLSSLVAHTGRSIAAVAVMVPTVMLLRTTLEATGSPWMLAGGLALLAGTGAVAYFATLFLLWHLQGRPASVEVKVAGLAREFVAKALRRSGDGK